MRFALGLLGQWMSLSNSEVKYFMVYRQCNDLEGA